jgi:hypothetical protein
LKSLSDFHLLAILKREGFFWNGSGWRTGFGCVGTGNLSAKDKRRMRLWFSGVSIITL